MESPRTPRTPKRVLPDDNNDEGSHEVRNATTLWEAIAKEMDDPRTITDELANQITGPVQINELAISSLYWIHEQDRSTPCVLRFPALLDIGGKYGRTGIYFNQQNVRNRSKISDKSIHKIKAIFELAKLPDKEKDLHGNPLYPPNAVECSERMFKFLKLCTYKLEQERNQGLEHHERPVPNGFFRDYFNSEEELVKSTFIVPSLPFFTEIEDASTVEAISDLEIQWDKQKMSDLLNDETLTQKLNEKTKKGNTSSQGGGSGSDLTLNSLYDPNYRYSKLKDEGHGSTKLVVPQVFDQDNELILPMEYKSKFDDKTPVIVDVELRVWELLPRSNGLLGSPIKQRKQANMNGSRRYQLVLKSMKLLAPCAPDSPQKRKSERGTLHQWMSPRAPNSPSPSESPTKRAKR